MSVYTSVSDTQMRDFLLQYDLGDFVSLQGIAQGITNSNYFLTTSTGRYVLTVFEVLKSEELPFFLELNQHLSLNGVACAAPIARKDGRLHSILAGKPACLVTCLNDDWWRDACTQLLPVLDSKDAALLQSEIAALDENLGEHLPSGIIHADLFKDNVLLNGDEVSGFIDFYYACNGNFMYDLAIAVNDWARTADNKLDPVLYDAFIHGYESVRPLSDEERAYFPTAQRAGCIRFWVSRLLDFHFPQSGEMTFIKDPNAFRDLLLTLK